MKILNLYAGIGGNRKLWKDVEVTAVEIEPKIAEIYSDFFPDDTVVVGDAHEYLLKHFGEFDFIWSSPPCPTHSRIRTANTLLPHRDNTKQIANGGGMKPAYPDMKLYEEILFLMHFYRGLWCVENVISYYVPLIPPQEVAQHYFWSNFFIRPKRIQSRLHDATMDERYRHKGFDLSGYSGIDKRKVLRNCVEPETAAHVMDCATNPIKLQGAML